MFHLRRYLTTGILFRLLVLVVGFFVANETMAASNFITIGSVSTHVGKSVSELSRILEDMALICGIGFILASFFKFHQHKLNPTQVPMSQGVTLLIIGAGLSVFPHLLGTVSEGVFNTGVDKLGGSAIVNIIGTGT